MTADISDIPLIYDPRLPPDVFEFVQSQRIDRFKVEGGEIVEHRVLTPADTDWPLRVQK